LNLINRGFFLQLFDILEHKERRRLEQINEYVSSHEAADPETIKETYGMPTILMLPRVFMPRIVPAVHLSSCIKPLPTVLPGSILTRLDCI